MIAVCSDARCLACSSVVYAPLYLFAMAAIRLVTSGVGSVKSGARTVAVAVLAPRSGAGGG